MAWQAQGFKAWLLQRLTAVYIGIYFILASFYLIGYIENYSYQQWLQLISQPLLNVSLLLFFYAILLHAWIGIRDVVMDYVEPVTMRIILLTFIALGLFVLVIWVSLILMSVLKL